MCLNVNENIVDESGNALFRRSDPQIATRDIQVYKVLPVGADRSGYGFQYAPNSRYTKKDISNMKAIQDRGIANIGGVVDEGFHTLPRDKRAAVGYLGVPTTDPRKTAQRVIRMTIPEGSKYFIGGHNNLSNTGCVGYCSEELVTTTLDHDYFGLGDPLPGSRLTPRGLATLSNKAKAQQRGPGGRFV